MNAGRRRTTHSAEKTRRHDVKKTTKKNPSKTSQKKAARDLDVKPGKGGTVRGGPIYVQNKEKWIQI